MRLDLMCRHYLDHATSHIPFQTKRLMLHCHVLNAHGRKLMVATNPLVGLRDALTQPFGQAFLGPELASHMTPDCSVPLIRAVQLR